MQKIFTASLLLILISISSCKPVLLGLYGIKSIKSSTNDEVMRYAKRHHFGDYNIYKIKPEYKEFIKVDSSLRNSPSFDDICSHKKNLSQPIQYLLFNNNDSLIVYTINCYASGFPNLKWNKNGEFEQFPPILLVDHIDSSLQFSTISQYLEPIDVKKDVKGAEYTCVIFWSRIIGRQSRRLINIALKNIEEEKKKGISIKVMLVNSDNIFLDN